MPFFENEGSAPRGKTLPEPVDHNLADVLNPYLQLTCTGIDDGAYRQPDQVIGVGQRIHLVEIVNTPYQPAKLVAPCSKAGDVQIPYRQHLRGSSQFGAHLGKHLRPAVEGSTQERDGAVGHLRMLIHQWMRNDGHPLGTPKFKPPRAFNDVHP